ncbi:MAG: winged helix-turn-helix domain-containing protein [Candidatus Krumholzibacteriia bacterium]
MNRPQNFAPSFRVDGRLVQPDLNRICGPEGEVQVEPRVMQVLLALSRTPGRVVSRNDILDEVWGDQIVGEENLTRAISELRRIFGDQAREPRYIETIRHHGYRLIAPVTEPENEAAGDPAEAPGDEAVNTPDATAPDVPAIPSSPVGGEPPRPRSRRPGRIPLGAVIIVAITAVAVNWWLDGRRGDAGDPVPAPSPEDVRPLTSYTGRERHPALSPDGLRVAFAWSGPETEGPSTSLFIKQQNSETPLQLTDAEGWVAWPAWSPDGQTIAYVQGGGGRRAVLCTIPSLGGPVRELAASAGLIEGLDWSPDGDSLVYSALDTLEGIPVLMILDLPSLTTTVLDPERFGPGRATLPRMSPDGSKLAWVASDPGGGGVLMGSSWPDPEGPARRLAEGLGVLGGLAWSPDGRSIVFGAAPAGEFSLWTVSWERGEPLPLTIGEGMAWNPHLSRRSGDLVFEQLAMDRDLWCVKVLESSPWRLESRPFAPSTRWEFEADFSPDGGRVAFVSARSGAPEIWLADSTGADLTRLTDLAAEAITHPRWSPDGTRIGCNILRGGRLLAAVCDARGGAPRELTTAGANLRFSAWTPDGLGVLLAGPTDRGWRLLRTSLEEAPGETGPVDFLPPGLAAVQGEFSPDGRHLYFIRPGVRGLWRVTLGPGGDPEGDPQLVVAEIDAARRDSWRISGGQVVWVMRASGLAYLALTDTGTLASTLVTDLPGWAGEGIAAAPTGRAFLYPHTRKVEADLMWIPGFAR